MIAISTRKKLRSWIHSNFDVSLYCLYKTTRPSFNFNPSSVFRKSIAYISNMYSCLELLCAAVVTLLSVSYNDLWLTDEPKNLYIAPKKDTHFEWQTVPSEGQFTASLLVILCRNTHSFIKFSLLPLCFMDVSEMTNFLNYRQLHLQRQVRTRSCSATQIIHSATASSGTKEWNKGEDTKEQRTGHLWIECQIRCN